MLPDKDSGDKPILEEGRNCWRIRKSNRAAFLVDSESYFAAFVEALKRAERQVIILGWDIDTRTELVPGNSSQSHPTKLGQLFRAVVSKKPNLHIYMLLWDFSFVYLLERELFPFSKLEWAHRRLHFRFDSKHPFAASHHQKVIVVDNRVAFSGGIDLAMRRWDRPAHDTRDPLRVDVTGKLYPPTHDIQMIVDGDAASSLGDLARERWRRATGQTLSAEPAGEDDPWPPSVRPDLKNVEVAIARTEPKHRKERGVREVERLYLDSFAAAKRNIYIENQYVTSELIGEAIIKRLQERDGPEIVMVIPERTSGWLSKLTMDVCRTRRLRELRQHDPYGHLRIYFPTVPGLEKNEYLEVHAKICVIDDEFARVGSANLCDRSMGLDTECDLAVEARGDSQSRRSIAHFRNLLLGQHLDVPPEAVADAVEAEQSLIKGVEKLRNNNRTLLAMKREAPKWLEKIMFSNSLLDPDRPLTIQRILNGALSKDKTARAYSDLIRTCLILLAMILVAGVWRWTPLADWFSAQSIVYEANHLKGSQFMPLFVYGFYLVGGLLFFPVLIMIIATALLFDPWRGFFYALSGSMLSAIFTYYIGRVFGSGFVREWSGSYMDRLSRRLRKNDVMALMALRVVPIAPFTAVNAVAGASEVGFWAYVVTTFLGLFPGIFAITIFGHGLGGLLRKPTLKGTTFLVVWAILTVLTLYVMRRWLSKYAYANDGLKAPRAGERNPSDG